MIQPSIVTMSSVHMNRSGMMYTSKDHVIGVVLFCLLCKVLCVLGIQYFITICSFDDKPSKNKGNRISKRILCSDLRYTKRIISPNSISFILKNSISLNQTFFCKIGTCILLI